MRPCSAAVRAFLDGWGPRTRAAVCDLYTFTWISGEVFRFASWQQSVAAPAPETDGPLITFPRDVVIDRGKTTTQVGVTVDVMDVHLYTTEADLIANGGTISWQDALRQGLFDGAYCEMWRCFMSPPGTVIGTIVWFEGHVGDVEIGRTRCTLHVKSLLNLLKAQMPKRLFQSSCTFVFGDPQCGFDRDVDGPAGPSGGGPAYATTVTVDGGTTQSQLHVTGLAPDPATIFNQGTAVGVTGANAGYKRTIVSLRSEIAYLLYPWVFPVVEGDTFRFLPGCPHTLDACLGTFHNVQADGSARDGGWPFIPPPETAI
jgi:uncharacterized phage protein (TIGR02218 family)